MRRSVNWRSAGRYFVWSRPIALTDEGERDHAKTALERAFAALRPDTRMTEEKIDAFARLMREKATQGPIPFRRAYLRSVIDQVEVDDDGNRIFGKRDVLERLVASGEAAAGVPSFVWKRMAHPKRFELLTPRFVVWCSIQLSYGCVQNAAVPLAWRSSKTSFGTMQEHF